MKTLFLSIALLTSIFTSMSTDETTNTVSNDTCVEVLPPVIINNADVAIFPGGDNASKTFVPKSMMTPLGVDLIVTGIKAAADGKEIVIYATYGNIILLTNHPDSDNANRIAPTNIDLTIEPGEALELKYSASAGKWIVTGSY